MIRQKIVLVHHSCEQGPEQTLQPPDVSLRSGGGHPLPGRAAGEMRSSPPPLARGLSI